MEANTLKEIEAVYTRSINHFSCTVIYHYFLLFSVISIVKLMMNLIGKLI